jgi:hypothetical protein
MWFKFFNKDKSSSYVKGFRSLKIIFLFLTFLFFTNLNAHVLNFAVWNQQLSLHFSTSAQSFANKNCSSVVTIQARRSRVAYNVQSNLTVNLSGPPNMVFYSDITCVVPITSVTIPSGSSTANFYFIDTANASPTITARADNYQFAQQIQSLSTNNFIWTGAVNSDWSTGGNWSGGVVPGASDLAVFDNSCTLNCSPTIVGALSLRGLRLSLGYTGTITQPNFDFTIGTGGFVQAAGTFVGHPGATRILYVNNGHSAIAAGSFTSPGGTTRPSLSWNVYGSPTVTFPLASTLHLYCQSGWTCQAGVSDFTPGSVNYANLLIDGFSTSYDLKFGAAQILGNFSAGDRNSTIRTLSNGTINVYGNVTTKDNGYTSSTATVVLRGNASGQTITGVSNTYFPSLQIEAGANPVTLTGVVQTTQWTMISVGAFTVAGSTLFLTCTTNLSCDAATVNINLGSAVYNNLEIRGQTTTYDFGGVSSTINGSLVLGEKTTTPGNVRNGTLNVSGDVTLALEGYNGRDDFKIVLKGNVAGQNITGISGKYMPPIEVDTVSHPVTLNGTLMTTKWTLTSVGTFTSTGSTLFISCNSGMYCDVAAVDITPGTVAYNNFTIRGFRTDYDFNSAVMTVNGNLVFGERSATGGGTFRNVTFNVAGDVSNVGEGWYGTLAYIILTGNPLGQTITGVSGKGFLRVEVNTGAHPVTLAGTILTRNFNYVSSGAFNTAGSTLVIRCSAGWTDCDHQTLAMNLGNQTYDNLTFNGYSTAWDLTGDTITVNGNFSFGDTDPSQVNERIDNATINVFGNITATNRGDYGTAILVAKGNPSGQTITGVSARGFPHLRIEAGVHPIALAGEIRTPNFYYISSGTFTAGTSTVTVHCSGFMTWDNCSGGTKSPTFGSVNYRNISFSGSNTTWDLGGATVNMTGNLSITDVSSSTNNINSGTINVQGNVTSSSQGARGSAWIVLTGGGATQTVSGSALAHRMPRLRINSGATAVTFSGSFTIYAYEYLSSGTFTSTGSTLQISCQTGQTCVNNTVAIIPGSVLYNNITFNGESTAWNLSSGTLRVGGNLSMGDQVSAVNGRIENGTLQVSGNVSTTSLGVGGNAALALVGTTTQTLTGATAWPSGNVTVNQGAGGSVVQASIISWNSAGQSMTITNGSYNMSGFALTVNNVLTIGIGTTLTRSGGALTYGSLVNNGTLNP